MAFICSGCGKPFSEQQGYEHIIHCPAATKIGAQLIPIETGESKESKEHEEHEEQKEPAVPIEKDKSEESREEDQSNFDPKGILGKEK